MRCGAKEKIMSPSMWRRYEREQDRVLKATMPKSGVVEYDDLLPKIKRTGWVWRNGKAVKES